MNAIQKAAVATVTATTTVELHEIAATLWQKIVGAFPDELRNDVGPFATGVE